MGGILIQHSLWLASCEHANLIFLCNYLFKFWKCEKNINIKDLGFLPLYRKMDLGRYDAFYLDLQFSGNPSVVSIPETKKKYNI